MGFIVRLNLRRNPKMRPAQPSAHKFPGHLDGP